MGEQKIHFVTGRLAELALREILHPLAAEAGFEYTVQVMPITVAALMSVDWISKRIEVPAQTDRVILPGYCRGDVAGLANKLGVPVEIGPKDVRRLPQFFGKQVTPPDLSTYDIKIIAEINHAPLKTIDEVVEMAKALAADGADLIDIGGVPGTVSLNIADYVRAVRDQGLRVSIDSLEVEEIAAAVRAGAELVLSVNQSNREAAADWGCEVVVIPDEPSDLGSMRETMELLGNRKVKFRVDPILEPIGLGFANSLGRYIETRREFPECEMMMGIGNLTELTDVDSAGVNFMLLGICQELGIRTVLTTQVINWARSSVVECDIARRMVAYACRNRVPPKNLSEQLVVLRDSRLLNFSESQIEQLAEQIRDHNYRILANDGNLHLLGSGEQFSGTDPFAVFDALAATEPDNLDASHAFYLGFEMCKAMIANQLGKNYVQDEALEWGHLTVEEKLRHRLSKKRKREI